MTRQFVRFTAIAVLLLAISLSVVHSQYPWPMFHHDGPRTGYTSSPGPNMNLTLWTYNTAHDLFGPCPAVVDGVLYISGGYGTALYAINATTGAGLWNYTVLTWISSSPAVANGMVYFGGFDRNVTAINATDGAFVWNFTTPGWLAASSPAVDNGIVYIGGGYGKGFYALNATNGAQIWSYNTSDVVHSSPAVSDSMVYFGCFDHNVYALDATTGIKIWNYTTMGDIFSSPAVANGMVYVGSYDGDLYAFNATTGTKIWNYTTGNWVASSPGVANGIVYVGSFDNNIYAFNASTGAKLWNYTTGGPISSSPAVSSNGFVYIGSGDNKTYALNAQTGAVVWTYQTAGDVFPSPAVVDGVVYAASRDGKVYAFIGSSQEFDAVWDTVTYPVGILSNSSLSGFQFSQSDKQINFTVIGPNGMSSFCNVTIPKDLLQEPWTLNVGGSTITPTISSNSSHSTLYFEFTHSSSMTVSITGSRATYLTLSVEPAGSGTTNPAVGLISYAEGENATVTISAASGYKFDYWELDGENVSQSTTYTFAMLTNHTLTAHLETAPGGIPVEYLIGAAIAIVVVAAVAIFILVKRRK